MNFPFWGRQREAELEEEIQSHLTMAVSDRVEHGETAQQAKASARREFGSVGLVKEVTRAAWGWMWLEQLGQDLRYGSRMLFKNPGFTLIAVITLALGIGANTAIFSVVNSVLLRPLPYPEPDRLAMVYGINLQSPEEKLPLCVADFLDWKSQNQVFESLAGFSTNRFNYTGGETPQQIDGAWVTSDFFSTIGVKPAMGRAFLPDEDLPTTPQTVIVSDAFWRRYLDSDPNAIDRQIILNARAFIVIGIMPRGFSFPEKDTELWAAERLVAPRRGPYYISGLGRLRQGATLRRAQSEMDGIARRVQDQINSPYRDWTWTTSSLAEEIVGKVRPALLVLLVTVLFVLLIACANITNLLLARATAREREMSVRIALGAGRARLLRQLLTESLLLAAIGAATGLPLAIWGIHLLVALGPEDLPRSQEIHIDAPVLGFTLLVAAACGLIFGLAPALQSSPLRLNHSLKEAGRRETERSANRRMRSALVVAEIALSLMLLIGAGLMVRSFSKLKSVSPGFKPDHILTMHLTLPRAKYDSDKKIINYYRQLIDRVAAVRGVETAGLSCSLPPNNLELSDSFSIEGKPWPQGVTEPSVPVVFISPEYFSALGVPLLQGRSFSAADKEDSPPVVIISQRLAEQYFAGETPIGKRIRNGGADRTGSPWMEIVGVVGDVKYSGLDAKPEPAYYVPLVQNVWRAAYLVVRAPLSSASLLPALREQIWALDNDMPIAKVATMDRLLDESVAQPRFRTLLLGLFASLALVLASVGIYGVMSYSTTQRAHEIGIRMALGAQSRDVINLVVRQGMTLVVMGVAIGVGAALGLMRLMSSLLYGVSATDPLTFSGVALLLALVAIMACWIPARRAAKADPMAALRYE